MVFFVLLRVPFAEKKLLKIIWSKVNWFKNGESLEKDAPTARGELTNKQ